MTIPIDILQHDINMTILIYPSCRMKRKEIDQRPKRITKPQRSASKPKAVARVDVSAILNVGSKICWRGKRRGGGIDPFEGRGGHDRVIIPSLHSRKIFKPPLVYIASGCLDNYYHCQLVTKP